MLNMKVKLPNYVLGSYQPADANTYTKSGGPTQWKQYKKPKNILLNLYLYIYLQCKKTMDITVTYSL